ncbi:Dna-directed rna polymerase iii subunit rpc10 [Thalictrum thalictroides]|uniref:DNA-directed RNA polymerase subunit n=1 Tax=Thalictrum thalictroides TaxID=46969 RepID=A0A7J6USI9_THATH|nr:Dna-directed rna polymerase iii subunit rpc10 [Thalictrum thalictroides]
MEFCPTCGNMLQYEPYNVDVKGRFFCRTCPYVCEIENKITIKHPVEKKVFEPIFSKNAAAELADQTDAFCRDCHHNRAYYNMLQVRSADEPMSKFFKCCNCGATWRED